MFPGAGRNGICPRPAGAVSESPLAKMWLLAVAATLIESGAVEGEPTVPSPKSSRSLPAEITGTTPALHDVRDDLRPSGRGPDRTAGLRPRS